MSIVDNQDRSAPRYHGVVTSDCCAAAVELAAGLSSLAACLDLRPPDCLVSFCLLAACLLAVCLSASLLAGFSATDLAPSARSPADFLAALCGFSGGIGTNFPLPGSVMTRLPGATTCSTRTGVLAAGAGDLTEAASAAGSVPER